MMGRRVFSSWRGGHGEGAAAGGRRQAAEWVELIDQWQASGLSLPAFCEQNGLNAGTMSGWVYKRTHKATLEQARREASGEGCGRGIM